MTKSTMLNVCNYFVFAIAITGCNYAGPQKDNSLANKENAGFALDGSSSPSPSTAPATTCPTNKPNPIWTNNAKGVGVALNCTGGIGPDYATWVAEDIYNQDKAHIIESCTESGGSAIVGSRAWIPGKDVCEVHRDRPSHLTLAPVTCCAEASVSPSPGPNVEVLCTSFGANYTVDFTDYIIGNGSGTGCTAAKAESRASYDAYLAALANSCDGKTTEYGVYFPSRCSQSPDGTYGHQATGWFKCCVERTSPSPTSTPTSSQTPTSSPSPTSSQTPVSYPSPSDSPSSAP